MSDRLQIGVLSHSRQMQEQYCTQRQCFRPLSHNSASTCPPRRRNCTYTHEAHEGQHAPVWHSTTQRVVRIESTPGTSVMKPARDHVVSGLAVKELQQGIPSPDAYAFRSVAESSDAAAGGYFAILLNRHGNKSGSTRAAPRRTSFTKSVLPRRFHLASSQTFRIYDRPLLYGYLAIA